MTALRPASLRARVTWTVLALLAAVLVVLFTVVDVALSARLHADARTRLTDRIGLARQLAGDLSARQLVDRLGGDGVTVELCRTDGSGCVSPAPGAPGPAGRPGRPRDPAPKAKDPVPVQAAGSLLYARTPLGAQQVLTLSLDTTQITDAVRRLVLFELVGGAVALLLAGLASARLSRAALRPLEDMTALARRIAAGDRGRRLGTAGPDSELSRTAAAFDAMLDGLEAALVTANAAETRMRTFLADASHELRTPLAGLQANAELLLREDPGRAERERIAVALVRESRRAARLVDDLLTMARLGQGLQLAAEPVDLVELATAEAQRSRALAPGLTVVVAVEPSRAIPRGPAEPGDVVAVEPGGVVAAEFGCIVAGDPLRLGQIVTNLLDNARHATTAPGTITMTVCRRADRVLLDVADTGPGVPAAERELIFQRFGRGDTSRSRHTGGAGLGLPIARGLARAHGGELSYADGGPGARFVLNLPALTPPG